MSMLDIRRNGRIQQLYQMALRGSTHEQLIQAGLAMGVTKPTAVSYVRAVRARLNKTQINKCPDCGITTTTQYGMAIHQRSH